MIGTARLHFACHVSLLNLFCFNRFRAWMRCSLLWCQKKRYASEWTQFNSSEKFAHLLWMSTRIWLQMQRNALCVWCARCPMLRYAPICFQFNVLFVNWSKVFLYFLTHCLVSVYTLSYLSLLLLSTSSVNCWFDMHPWTAAKIIVISHMYAFSIESVMKLEGWCAI